MGYGGTKTELERLVSDASELTGKALDPTKFSDIIEAIHAVQENMGITGTTALEAATTIEGSVNTMKASWSNWLTGLGREDADMSALTDQLLESMSSVAKNVGPRVVQIMRSLVDGLPEVAAGAVSTLGPILAEALAGAWNVAAQALGSMGIQLPGLDADTIMGTLSGVLSSIGGIFQQIGPYISTFINSILPPLASALQTIGPLIGSIATTVLPPILSMLGPIISALLQVVSAVLPPLASAVQALAPIFMQIVSAVLPPLLSLIQQIMPVVQQIATFIGGVLVAAIQMLSPIISALTPVIQMVFSVASTLLNSVIIPIITPLMQLVQMLLPPLAGLISGLQGPLSVAAGAFNMVLGAVQSVCEWIGNLIGKIGEVGSAIANSPIGQFVGGVASGIGGLLGFAKGGFTTGPYIAGEDPRYPNEAVISFNPGYRAQNIRYWERAGHMLGVSPRAVAETTAASSTGGGGAVYDFSGMTFAPNVEVRGNASQDDIIAAIRQCEGEFVDMVKEMLSRDGEAAYA